MMESDGVVMDDRVVVAVHPRPSTREVLVGNLTITFYISLTSREPRFSISKKICN